ncbi:MAG: hypothetical protein E7158_05735 [Firmicutes bacterium]|nr:hypothetical protein [Bacillota bacterium]
MNKITNEENEGLKKILFLNNNEIETIKDDIDLKERKKGQVEIDIKTVNERISKVNEAKLEVEANKISAILLDVLMLVVSIVFSSCIYNMAFHPLFVCVFLSTAVLTEIKVLKNISDNNQSLKDEFGKGLKQSNEIIEELEEDLKYNKGLKNAIEEDLIEIQTKLKVLSEINEKIKNEIPQEIDVIDLESKKEEAKAISMKMSKEDFIKYLKQISETECKEEEVKTDMMFNGPRLIKKR